jgi:transcriptional regulator with XRE-family HTH domain
MSLNKTNKGAVLLKMVMKNWPPCGLTVESAASMLEIDRSTLLRWTSGRSRPDGKDLLRVEEMFGVSPRMFWIEVEE